MWESCSAYRELFSRNLFATRTRYSGAAVSREVASVVFGGLSPLIAVSLAASAGGAYWPVALYVIALSAITFTAATTIPETYRDQPHARGVRIG